MKNILIIVILIIFTSCGPLKNIRDRISTTKETELNEKSSDTTKIKETNKAIKDDIAIPIPEGASPETTAALIDLIKRMQSSKSSGDNSYKLWYDEQLNQLRLRVEIAETQNKELATKNESNTEKTFTQEKEEFIKKVKNSIWTYVFAFLFFWPYIKPIVMMFLGPTNLMTGIKKIMDKQRNS